MAILDGFEKQKKYIAKDEGFMSVSQWTHSDSVEFTGGDTLTDKIQEINTLIENVDTGLDDKLSLTGGTMTGQIQTSREGCRWLNSRDNALIKRNNPNSGMTFYPIVSSKALSSDWSMGTLGNDDNLYFVNTLDSNYSGGTNQVRQYYLYNSGSASDTGSFKITYASALANNQIVVADGTNGKLKTTGFTISTNVPANAVFTDTKVTQTNTTNNADYRILFGATADNTTRTEGARKSGDLKYNPSSKTLTVPKVKITSDLWIYAGFVVADGYGAISGESTYAYLGYRSNKQSRDNDIRVYKNYVCTAENQAIKLWNDGHIDCESLELKTREPYIDFHRNNSTADYTGRIINRDEGYLDFYKTNAAWATLRAASFNTQSSIHIKTNVEDITDDEAKKLLELRPVSFDYINGDSNQRGLIAEEVMEILPNTVSIPDDYTEFNPNEPWNTPSIDYSKYVPYLIKMIQIQQQEIDELKRRYC